MNLVCWIRGHDVGGKTVEKSSNNNAAGEWRDCWQYYCKRCQDPNNFPLDQFPDPRNLYQRTIRFQIVRWRNWWYFRDIRRNKKLSRGYFQFMSELRRAHREGTAHTWTTRIWKRYYFRRYRPIRIKQKEYRLHLKRQLARIQNGTV